MVKRLLGFVVLIGIVALLLQWVSLQRTQPEPEPEPEVEVQVAVTPPEPSKEMPAPEPKPTKPETSEPTASTPPAAADEPPPEPEPPAPSATERVPEAPPAAEASATTEPEAPSAPSTEAPESESPAASDEASRAQSDPSAAERQPASATASDEEKPRVEPEPSAPADAERASATPPVAEASAAEEPEPPSAPIAAQTRTESSAAEGEASSAASEPLRSSASEQPPMLPPTAEKEGVSDARKQPATPTPAKPVAPPAPEPAAVRETHIEERVIPDDEFVAVEQAQGRTDERTDAQRRHQEGDSWYGWGVLGDYADPDRASRLLGGAAVVQGKGSFFTIRANSGGEVTVRPIGNVSAAYGSIGLRGHGEVFRQRLHRALATGQLLGREADYELWYLFPRREATHLGNKVVAVFECQVRESGLVGETADRFREQSKLRGAVLALRRANGGRLGIYLPRYFQTEDGRVPVAPACRELDEESRRYGSQG